MINFIKNWWNSKHCFAKNPLFWLLTAGACAAAPFTGFLSLAAIPVLAGVAQTGYLPHDKLSAGVKWLFLGSSVNKGQAILQDDTHNEENSSSSPHAYHIIEGHIENASQEATRFMDDTQHSDEENRVSGRASSSGEDSLSSASLSPEAQLHREATTDLRERQQAEQTLPDEQKWMSLSDEVLYTLASIYKRRYVLHLNSQDEQDITTLLNEVPEDRKPLDYSEEEQREFHVCRKGGLSWQETDEDFKKRLEENSGRKIAAKLLIRFSDDHARLSQYKDEKEQPIPIIFKTSRNITLSHSLQAVCSFLNQLLIRVFVRKEETSELTSDEPTPSPHNWQVSPDFFKDHDELDALYDSLAETYRETGQIHDRRAERFRKRKLEKQQRIAEMDERHEQFEREHGIYLQKKQQWRIENLNTAEQVILQDNTNFDTLRAQLNHVISEGCYLIEVEHVKGLIDEKRLTSEIIDNLMRAIINKDKQLTLTHRCFQTPENPQGFITTDDIHRLFPKEAASKIIQKLTAPQQASSGLLSFLTKSNSGSSHSSQSSLAEEETKEGEVVIAGKKKAVSVVQETFSI